MYNLAMKLFKKLDMTKVLSNSGHLRDNKFDSMS
jgi:hypothetical protein